MAKGVVMKMAVGVFLFFLFVIPLSNASALEPVEIYKNEGDAVILVYAHDRKKRSTGTGFFIRSDGFIITNAHVVLDEDDVPLPTISIYKKPKKITGSISEDLKNPMKAKIVKLDVDLDLALLKISNSGGQIKNSRFGDSSKVNIGQAVVAIGHPEQGGLWTLTTGTISSRMKNSGRIEGKNLFQTDASINHGNSGGPLLDKNGLVIGINTSIARKSRSGSAITGVNFAIESATMLTWLRKNGVDIKAVKPPKAVAVPDAKVAETKAKPVIQKSAIVTPKKPYKTEDLEKTVAEMEGMMGDMRGLLKNKKEKFKW